MCDCGEKAYNTRALKGFGEAYNTAALKGFGEAYNTAALKGFGEAYNNAALRGAGEAYNNAALKGGFVLPSLASIATAIEGAKLAYDGLKWVLKKMNGGRALFISPEKRTAYINDVLANVKGRRRAAMMPYTIPVAQKHFAKRKARLSQRVRKYLEDHNQLEDALFDTKTMKQYVKQVNEALAGNAGSDDSDIVTPTSKPRARKAPTKNAVVARKMTITKKKTGRSSISKPPGFKF